MAKALCCLKEAQHYRHMQRSKRTTLTGLNVVPRLMHLRTASCTIMDDACYQIVRLAPSLDLMMSSGRLPLDSSYRKLIEQRRHRNTVRTNIQPRVAWVKLNADWIRAGGGGVVELNKTKDNISG